MVLLARSPRAARVKRRLALPLGGEAARALHAAFVSDTLRWLRGLHRRGWRVRVEWSEPFLPDRALRRALRGLGSGLQSPGHLGRRIEAALRRGLAARATCALAIGSDAPHLGPLPLRLAARRLERSDVVLGPAEDGGYYLIGARRVRRQWFTGIDWGTPRVLGQTLARLRRDRVRVSLLGAGFDLDTVESVRRLGRALARSPALRRRLPATRRILRELRLPRPPQRRAQR